MKIGILSRSKELYSTRSLFEAGRRRKHTVSVIDHTRCSLVIDPQRPNVIYDGKPLHQLDAIIPRIGTSVTETGIAVINHFELMGVVSPTSAQALKTARDKLRSLQILTQHKIPVPRTIMIGANESLHQMAVKLGGFPLIVKLLEGTHGEGVELAKNFWDLQDIVKYHLRFQDRLLLQEFIREARGADTRVLVVAGKVVASMRRQAKPGEFRSNLHLGGSSNAITITPQEKELVEKVVAIMEIEIAGVDLLPSHKGPLVMEVNASPGLEGIEKTTGISIADHIIRLVEEKVKAK
jgi:ribosomal protein S6--L-glutamate ligase